MRRIVKVVAIHGGAQVDRFGPVSVFTEGDVEISGAESSFACRGIDEVRFIRCDEWVGLGGLAIDHVAQILRFERSLLEIEEFLAAIDRLEDGVAEGVLIAVA